MKQNTTFRVVIPVKITIFFLSLVLLITSGCLKDHHFQLRDYKQVNLVSDVGGFGAMNIDKNLANAWGIAYSPSGTFWISANHTGLSTIYNRAGATLRPPVVIPSAGKAGMGAPTGIVYNPTSNFVIPSTGAASKFIFAGEDGVITAWSGGNSAVKVADRSAFDAVYKGLAMANDGGHNFLYAANFKMNKVDVFDEKFSYVTSKQFSDPTIPAGFAPFNIRNIRGVLFVLYAKQQGPDNEDDEKGAGNGYVNIFRPNGTLIGRFASRGPLNSPWGIVPSVGSFCHIPNAILIGNFGDGRINIYGESGRFEGQLQKHGGGAVTIDGLWALENNVPGGDPEQLFFTAGPADEEHGLFGYLARW